MKIIDNHLFFYGEEFSNWHDAPFKDLVTGIPFQNSEQAFMWWKAFTFNDFETCGKIEINPNPRVNKQLGREVKNFDPKIWSFVSYGIMKMVNYAKYTQNPVLRDKLLSTGDLILVEASPYDKIWGIGMDETNPDLLDEEKWGHNLLGKALVEVRQVIKNEQ